MGRWRTRDDALRIPTSGDPSSRSPPSFTRRSTFIGAWRPPGEGTKAIDLANLSGIVGQLDEIRAMASEVGSALIVAAVPSAWPDADRFAALANGLQRFCAERQIAFVDLSMVLGRPARREFLLPADPVHPTAQGARLVAEALIPHVSAALQRR